jgi:hypothetical protein
MLNCWASWAGTLRASAVLMKVDGLEGDGVAIVEYRSALRRTWLMMFDDHQLSSILCQTHDEELLCRSWSMDASPFT